MPDWLIPASIVFGGWLVAVAIETGFKRLSARIDNLSRIAGEIRQEADASKRILGQLWEPIEGIRKEVRSQRPDREN